MTATIKLANKDDGFKIATLRRTWTDELGIGTTDDSFDSRFDLWFNSQAESRLFWLAEQDGVPIGMVNLLIFDRMPRPGVEAGRWGYLANMYVTPSHRGAGIGQQLAQNVLSHARSQGLDRVVLSPSERSIPFWQRLGFGDPGELLVYYPNDGSAS